MNNTFISKSTLLIKKQAPILLTCLGASGVIVTSVMAVKATPKALYLLEETKANKGSDLTKWEIMIAAGSVYIPSILMGTATIACIFGAHVLHKRQQEALTSAYILLEQSFKEYRAKVIQKYGEDADSQIRGEIVVDKYADDDGEECPISDGKKLFYEEHFGKFFRLTEQEVLEAEYHLNRNFALRGHANLNEFFEFLGLEKKTFGYVLGWSLGAGDAFYGYSWIDFRHQDITTDDGLECCMISMPFVPTADYLDY